MWKQLIRWPSWSGCLGDRQEAIDRLQQLLQRLPATLSSSVLLARMKLSENDLSGTEQILKAASAKVPHSSDAALSLGEMYVVTGQIAKAEVEIGGVGGELPDGDLRFQRICAPCGNVFRASRPTESEEFASIARAGRHTDGHEPH
jgi:predicted Zn-dependent protease